MTNEYILYEEREKKFCLEKEDNQVFFMETYLACQIPVEYTCVVNICHSARYTQRQSYFLGGAEHHLFLSQQLLQGAAVDVFGQRVKLPFLHADAHKAAKRRRKMIKYNWDVLKCF